MESSTNSKTGTARRRRYGVSDPQRSMTALKRRLLTYIAECGLLTTVQAGRIMGMNTEAVYKHLRHLYDLEMVERIAVPYASLAPLEANGPNLAFGPGQKNQ